MVRILHFHCGGPGSVPSWGIKVPQATHSSQKKKKKERKKVHKLGIRKFITIKLLWEIQQVTVPFLYANQENEILKLGISNDQGKNTASILK